MAAGIEIFDANGNLIMSHEDMTTYAIGEAEIISWQNKTIQNDALIGKDFWFNIKHFSTYPNAKYQQNLGVGYYIPALSYNKNTGTATFTWDASIKTAMNDGGFVGFSMCMMGASDFTIVYGGI